MAIQTFKHRGLRELFDDGRTRRIAGTVHDKLIIQMDTINNAAGLQDLAGKWAFHGLGGDRDGTYAFTVTRNWRLTFAFDGADAWDLDYEDYH